MTALMASFSAVIGDAAHRFDAEQLVRRRHRPFEAGLNGFGVGGTIGRPSVQPLLW